MILPIDVSPELIHYLVGAIGALIGGGAVYGALRERVKVHSEEIANLRNHFHDLAGKIAPMYIEYTSRDAIETTKETPKALESAKPDHPQE